MNLYDISQLSASAALVGLMALHFMTASRIDDIETEQRRVASVANEANRLADANGRSISELFDAVHDLHVKSLNSKFSPSAVRDEYGVAGKTFHADEAVGPRTNGCENLHNDLRNTDECGDKDGDCRDDGADFCDVHGSHYTIFAGQRGTMVSDVSKSQSDNGQAGGRPAL